MYFTNNWQRYYRVPKHWYTKFSSAEFCSSRRELMVVKLDDLLIFTHSFTRQVRPLPKCSPNFCDPFNKMESLRPVKFPLLRYLLWSKPKRFFLSVYLSHLGKLQRFSKIIKCMESIMWQVNAKQILFLTLSFRSKID